MKVIVEAGNGEVIEKKSRFLAQVFKVTTPEEAALYIEETRKKYWDARHNCYAYIIGNNGETKKFSDDGEPSGTAGKPILDVLERQGLTDCMVIVTRYFGGVLLGTGGLVRAYQKSTLEAVNASKIGSECECLKFLVETDYSFAEKIIRMCADKGFEIVNREYMQFVQMNICVDPDKKDEFLKEIAKITLGNDVVRDCEAVRIIK